MTDQYLRKWGLVVSSGEDGIDLSALRIQFNVTQADAETPNTAVIKVFNVAKTTADRIQNEFQKVKLQAGYEGGQLGVIFDGTIKQIKRGRDSGTDTYVTIYAADGDQAYNFSVVSKSLAAGSSLRNQLDAVAEATKKNGVTAAPNIPSSLGTGGTLPRGKVLFGMARERLTDIAASSGTTWSIQNGEIVMIPLTGYLADEIVAINSRTGMILVPTATDAGIEVDVLLNPLMKIGTRVQIDNSSVNQTTIKQQGFPRYGDLSFPANVTEDGIYRVLVVEHVGDTRGTPWYSHLTCLAVDASSPPGTSVQADG